jgi:hypothetical protein
VPFYLHCPRIPPPYLLPPPPCTLPLCLLLSPTVSLATLIHLICQIAIPFPSGAKIAALEKTIDDQARENAALEKKLVVANANAEVLVAKAQLQCSRELYTAVEDALEKGYQRSQKGFAEMKSFYQPKPLQ